MVPWLSRFEGISIFCDQDQIVRGDIHELFDWAESLEGDWQVAVRQDQEHYEWPSVMVFNNANCKHLTPEFVQDESNPMFGFGWADNIVDMPKEWNHCCGMMAPDMDAKLYHFTQGIPYWTECRGLQEDPYWFEEFEKMMHSVDWIDVHRGTKHFRAVMSRFLANYGVKVPS